MLQNIHNATKNWVGYIVLFILTIFLVGAFALWGVGDIFRGNVDTTVAEVGGRSITSVEYDRELKGQIRQLSERQNAELTMQEVRALGIDKVVLDRMIERTAIDERMHALGLTASDQGVLSRLQREPAFQGAGGTFDKGTFQRLLQSENVTEAEYVEGMRSDIARQQYLVAAVAGVSAPPRLARLLFDYAGEQRVAEYVVLDAAAAGNPPEPTEAQLAAYHKAHADQFSTPEYRDIEYVEIGVSEVAGEITVSEDDLKNAWERRKADFEKPEQRELEQIAFPSQAAAAAAHAKLQSGAAFASIAREAGRSDADLKLGTFTKTGLDPRLAAAAFQVPEGAYTPPVQGPFGWVILRAVKITPDQSQTFEQVREKLREGVVKERAADRISGLVNDLEDQLAADKPLAAAARNVGLTPRRANIDAKGLAPDGTKPAIPAAPVFLQQAFAIEAGTDSDPFSGDNDATYFVKVIGVKPPALKPLDTVRAQVRERWLAEQRSKIVLARTQTLAAEAQRSGSIDDAGRAVGHAPLTSPALTRGKPNDTFSVDALSKLFGSPPGAVIYARLGKGDGYVIARVTKVTRPAPTTEMLMAFRAQTSQQLAQDAAQTVALSARTEAGVEIHQKTIDTMLGETQ